MSRHRIAHRAEFSVRCACGMVYNTDDSHVGKQLKCRCGRTVTIARPKDEYADEYDAKAKAEQVRREAEAVARAKRDAAAKRRTAWRDRVKRVPSTMWMAVHESLSACMSRQRWRRYTARAVWGWSVLCVVSWLLLITTSESFLPATLLAYGPRFVMLLPFAALLPAALVFARATVLPLVIALLVVIGPIMGGRISLRTLGRGLPAPGAPGQLRVLSFNTEGGGVVAMQVREFLQRTKPDLIAMQECGDALWDTLQAIPGYSRARYATLCTLSRFPIVSSDTMPRRDFERISQFGFGGTGLVARYAIDAPAGRLAFVNLHLETARKGLEALSSDQGFIPDDMSGAARRLDPQATSVSERISLNAQIRDRESERASVWSAHGSAQTPVLVSGDFNLPVESTIFRRHWGGFVDAFESTGSGFGWSKREGRLLRIRIDHVLGTATAPKPLGAWIGDDLGSDHLPVIADLRWPR